MSYLIGLFVSSMVIFPRDVVNITVTIPLFFAMLLIGFKQKILVKASVVLMFFPIIISFNFLIQQIGTWIWINMLARDEIVIYFKYFVLVLVLEDLGKKDQGDGGYSG